MQHETKRPTISLAALTLTSLQVSIAPHVIVYMHDCSNDKNTYRLHESTPLVVISPMSSEALAISSRYRDGALSIRMRGRKRRRSVRLYACLVESLLDQAPSFCLVILPKVGPQTRHDCSGYTVGIVHVVVSSCCDRVDDRSRESVFDLHVPRSGYMCGHHVAKPPWLG